MLAATNISENTQFAKFAKYNSTSKFFDLQYRHKDKDPFIGLQEFVVGYSKAPEQPQSSARPICDSHTMMSTGREPTTIRIAAYRSSPRYALRHGRHNSMATIH